MTYRRVVGLILVLLSTPGLGAALEEDGSSPRPAAIRRAAEKLGPSIVAVRVVQDAFPAATVGSGVVVDAKRGIVATTGAPLLGDPRVEVHLADGRTFPSRRFLILDPAAELALIEVDAPDGALTAAEWADPTTVGLGDDVFVLGRSAQGRILASAGIVAEERPRDEAGIESSPILIDAWVPAEIGGGPVSDRDGRLLGVSLPMSGDLPWPGPPGRMIGGPRRGGFPRVVPAALIRSAVGSFGKGPASRSFIGVALGDARRGPDTPADQWEGALVREVAPGTPAARAGLAAGDLIIAVDGRKVREAESFVRVVDETPVGSTLALSVVRGGETLRIEVTTTNRPSVLEPYGAPPRPPSPMPGLGDGPGPEPRPAEPKTGEPTGSDLPKPPAER